MTISRAGLPAFLSLLLSALLAPYVMPGAGAQEYESAPGQMSGQPAPAAEAGPPAGEPPIQGVPPAYGGAPDYYNSYGQPQTEYSSQPQYEPPPFVNPRPVTNRYMPYPGAGYSQGPGYPYAQAGYEQAASGFYPGQPRFVTASTGLIFPCTLSTAIDTSVAHSGDYVQAVLDKNVALNGGGYIPAGTTVTGEVSQATGGRYFDRSGSLSLVFNQMRFPNGMVVPISAHTVGNIGKYADKGSANGDQYRGEGWKAKFGQFALRTALGAAGGMAFGTAIGGISHGSWATGMLTGTGFGAGLGALDSLTLRKGRNVMLTSGTPISIELDQPIQIPASSFAQTAAM